jgi:hypothetical protein
VSRAETHILAAGRCGLDVIAGRGRRGAPALSPLTRQADRGRRRAVRSARLRDGRTSELTGELSDLCVGVAAPPSSTPDGHGHGRSLARLGVSPRDRNRFLRPREPGATVIDDGTFNVVLRGAPRLEPTRQVDLGAGPVPGWLLR